VSKLAKSDCDWYNIFIMNNNAERETIEREEDDINPEMLTPKQRRVIRDGILPKEDGFQMLLAPKLRRERNLSDFSIAQTSDEAKQTPQLVDLVFKTVDEVVDEMGWDEYFSQETIDQMEDIVIGFWLTEDDFKNPDKAMSRIEHDYNSLMIEKQVGDITDTVSPLREGFDKIRTAYHQLERKGLEPIEEYIERKREVYQETYRRLIGEEPYSWNTLGSNCFYPALHFLLRSVSR